MSFYRTYRPQVISEIDNIAVRGQLLSLLSKKKKDLPHAYFFFGPKGAGKTTAARLIAKLFLCEHPSTSSGPCGTCLACTSIANGSYIDVLEIDAASNRGIDDVRELRDRIKLSPAIGAYKIFIIDEVHMMTTEAFNALLKTLEEPPAHAVFILATTDPQKVPATVRSRCMEVSFAKANQDELLSALRRIVKQEKMTITDDALTAIADIADGAFRDAVKLLEQASFIQGKITLEAVLQTILKSDGAKRELFLTSVLVDRNAKEALIQIEHVVSQGTDMKAFLTDCLRDLENDLIAKVKEQEIPRLKPWRQDDIKELTKLFLKAYDELRICAIPQLPIELAVLEFLGRDEHKMEKHDKHEIDERDKKDEHVIKKHDERKMDVNTPVIPRNPAVMSGDEALPAGRQESSQNNPSIDSSDHLNLEKLTTHWVDYIEALKPYNHSVAGVIRGARPKSVESRVVTIEAFYPFHQERLSDPKVRDILANVLKQLFGVKVRVDIVLGKK